MSLNQDEHLSEILRKVFDIATPERVELENVHEFLERKLSFFEVEDIPQTEYRLGPQVVGIDSSSISGILKRVPGSTSELEIESHSNFSSVRTTTCVYRGKWMYEVVLGTNGIQQLGWATLNCKFTNEEGVGDAPDSFAYDGRRVRKWNISDNKYGQAWVVGDVIGCFIDLDAGKISFSRNGHDLGVAFSNVRFGLPGLAYFPAVSLSHGERCLINCGATPFIYAAEGFKPIQPPPPSSELNKTSYLLECFHRLLPYMAVDHDAMELISEDDAIIIAAIIFQRLAPLLCSEYLSVSLFVPFLMDLSDSNSNWFKKTIDTLFICLEDFETTSLFSHIFSFLSLRTRTTPLTIGNDTSNPSTTTTSTSTTSSSSSSSSSTMPSPIGIDGSLVYLRLALELLRYRSVKEVLFKLPSMDLWLEALFVTKQLSVIDLANIFNLIRTELNVSDQYAKETEGIFSQWLSDRFAEHDRLLQDLCRLFVAESDLAATAFFREWIRNILRKNQGVSRNIQPPGLTDVSALINIFHNLITVLRPLLQGQDVSNFPSWIFCTEYPLPYFDLPRTGGSITHLKKEHPIPPEQFAVMVFNTEGGVKLEWELMDALAILFMLGPSLRIKLAAQHQQARAQAALVLEDLTERMRRSQKTEYQEHLRRLRDEEMEYMRLCAFHKANLYSPEWKVKGLMQCMEHLVDVLSVVSTQGAIFSYTPEYYLETLFEVFNALRRNTDPNVLLLPESAPIVSKIIGLLVSHCNDSRIINPDQRDLLLQTLNVLLQNADFVKLFESNRIAQSSLMKTVLSLFDNRFWVSTTNILLRFWRGSGFGHSSKLRGSGSTVFQDSLRRVCETEKELFGSFLHRLFDNLNSVVTEFVVPLREIKAILAKHLEYQQYFKKCNVMFELSVSLTRILEILSLEIPNVFLDHEINNMRLAEFLVYVLNRTTVGTDSQAFETVLSLKVLGLEKINRVAILSPIVGIITNLYKEEKKKEEETQEKEEEVEGEATKKMKIDEDGVAGKTSSSSSPSSSSSSSSSSSGSSQRHPYSIVKALVGQPAFSIANFEFLENFDWKVLPSDAPQEEPLLLLSSFVKELKLFAEKLKSEQETNSSVENEEECAICYTLPNNVHFEPCGHQSCHRCVERHLLTNNRCFFCNAEIKKVIKSSPSSSSSSSSSSSTAMIL